MEGRSSPRTGRLALILLLTGVFTCFGQRSAQHWTYVDTDREGFHYYIDAYSIREVGPGVVELVLRKSAAESPVDRRPFADRSFRVDRTKKTIQALDGDSPEEPIPVGSVAHAVLDHLRELSESRTSPRPGALR